MMMSRKKLSLCFLLLMLFSMPALAEKETKEVKEINAMVVLSYGEMIGKEYQMVSPFAGKLTLGFDVHNRIYGYTGLNRFWGQADIQNGKLKVRNVYTTENKGIQEQRILQVKYLTLLKDSASIHFEGETLVLTTPFNEKLIFTQIK